MIFCLVRTILAIICYFNNIPTGWYIFIQNHYTLSSIFLFLDFFFYSHCNLIEDGEYQGAESIDSHGYHQFGCSG